MELDLEPLREFLDEKVLQYNTPSFIELDPIQIPHLYSIKEDIEIAGFLTATISWGNRTLIIKNAKRMMKLMGNSPYNFIMSRFSRQERARAFAEERLKESEIKYRRLFTHMSEGFAVHELIYDSGQNAIFYKILTINSAYKKIINIPEEKIQGPWQLNFMVSHLPPI